MNELTTLMGLLSLSEAFHVRSEQEIHKTISIAGRHYNLDAVGSVADSAPESTDADPVSEVRNASPFSILSVLLDLCQRAAVTGHAAETYFYPFADNGNFILAVDIKAL